MFRHAYRSTLLVLYQFTLLCGIVLMPLALVTRRFGVHLPVGRAVLGLKRRYERAGSAETGG